jgi:hypothetical protein
MRSLGPVLLLALVCAACAGGDSGPPLWTESEAESIASVRSLPVNDAECEGRGEADEDRYASFDCVAGTRAPWETYDTIAVFYVVRPLAEYDGPRSRHRLGRVKFVGGPGIP